MCQGFELFGIWAAGGDKTVLKNVPCIGKTRQVDWRFPLEKLREESKTFSLFEVETLEKMKNKELVIHFHQWGFPSEDFQSNPALSNFFKTISEDTLPEGLKFVTGFEAFNYPFYCVLYHPEYQMMLNNSEDTVTIARSFSSILYREGLANHEKKLKVLSD